MSVEQKIRELERHISVTNGMNAFLCEILIKRGITSKKEISDAEKFIESNVDELLRRKRAGEPLYD